MRRLDGDLKLTEIASRRLQSGEKKGVGQVSIAGTIFISVVGCAPVIIAMARVAYAN